MIEETRKSFEEKGYAHIPNFLDPQSCRDVTSEFYRLREEGQTVKDDTQAPNFFLLSHFHSALSPS